MAASRRSKAGARAAPDEPKSGSTRSGLRLGLGDVLVLLSLVGLAALASWPHQSGRIEAKSEARAAEGLLALADELMAAELGATLRKALERSQKIEEVELRCSYGPELAPGQQLWDDARHRYLLDMEGASPALRVINKAEKAPSLRLTPGDQAEHAPEPARRLLELLAGEAWEALSAAQQRLRALSEDSSLGYRYGIGLMPRSIERAADCELELYAWPTTHGQAGHAAFRWSPSRGLQQTRNLVRRYEGERSPSPMAGAFRPGSSYDGAMGYTGLDGNQWLPVFRPVDIAAYRSFADAVELLEQSEFRAGFERLVPELQKLNELYPGNVEMRFDSFSFDPMSFLRVWPKGREEESFSCGLTGEGNWRVVSSFDPELDEPTKRQELEERLTRIAKSLQVTQVEGWPLLSKLGLGVGLRSLESDESGRVLGLSASIPPSPEEGAATARALRLHAWPEVGRAWTGVSHLVFGTDGSGRMLLLPRDLRKESASPAEQAELIWVPPPRQLLFQR